MGTLLPPVTDGSQMLGLSTICCSHRSTPYSAYDPETYSGHWKQLTVRTSRRGQAMAIAYFHPQVSSEIGPLGEGVQMETVTQPN